MVKAKRIWALCLALLMLVCLSASAEVVAQSEHGAFAAEKDGVVYASLYTGSAYGLFSVPIDGGEMTSVDSAAALEELLYANNNLYYIRTAASGNAREICRLDESGKPVVLSAFENDVVVERLCWYDDVLYCLAGGRLYIVDPNNGIPTELCDILIDDYVIVDDVIFYIAADDTMSYEKTVASQETPVSQASGTFWSMSILGTNPEKLLDKGISDLRAYGNYIYFHNLEDNYLMGSGDDMWLEGKLYRYNIQTNQIASMNIDYDWDFYPTEQGVVIYKSQDISIYPLTGGEGTQLMTPELRTSLTALGANAYVYEYTSGRLTKLALDGSGQTVLADDGDVLPDVTGGSTDTVLVDEGTDATDTTGATDTGDGTLTDQTYDETTGTVSAGSADSYIFPNSSTTKLTRAQILAVDKSLWGYARNEIYARHGYDFKNGKYKTYFDTKSWYKPGGFSSGALNSIEWSNMELLKELEHEYGLLEGSGTSAKNSGAKNNYYVLKEASSRRLSKSYLRKKLGSKSKYALARNEILARHGYVFKTTKYKTYFNNQKWYSAGGYSSGSLSRIEWYNIEQLKDLENGY